MGSIKGTDNGGDVDPFLTNPKENHTRHPNQTFTHSFYREHGSSTPSKNNCQSKGIENSIKKREADIEEMVVHAQCNSLEECTRLYKSLDVQNDQLIGDIT